MIQRIQSIYLFGCVLAQSIFVFFEIGSYPFLLDLIPSEAISGLSLLLVAGTLLCLFLFKFRAYQLIGCRLILFLVVLKLAAAVYQGIVEGIALQNALPIALEFVSVLFVFLAHRAIKKDDDLVKSVDRIR